MTDTMRLPSPASHTSSEPKLRSNERAAHLKGMDEMFSAAIREEMKATQEFLAALKRLSA